MPPISTLLLRVTAVVALAAAVVAVVVTARTAGLLAAVGVAYLAPGAVLGLVWVADRSLPKPSTAATPARPLPERAVSTPEDVLVSA